MDFVVDVICDASQTSQDKDPRPIAVESGSADDDFGDPCVFQVKFEHKAGCAAFDLVQIRRVLGTLMILIGFILAYLHVKSMKWFMLTIVQLTVLFVLLAVFMQENYLGVIDPTAPPKQKSIVLGVAAVSVAFIAALLARWLFKKFIRFGPTVIGCGAGYLTTIYTILIINGVGSVFQERNATAVVGENGQVLWALFGILFGGWVGYNYAFVFILCVQCFVSAYLVVRGWSLWINYGFPNEAALIQHAYGSEKGPQVEIPTMFWFYVVVIIMMWAVNFYNAWKSIHEWPKSSDLEDD
jgi:hypothetical protein